MDPMVSAGKAKEDSASAGTTVVPAVPTFLPAALPSGGAAQFAAALFQPRARAAAVAFAGMLQGTPATSDIFLPGGYPRSLEPATAYHHIHYPYSMASAKGSTSSYDGEIGVSKKPRTVFSPKQLLYLEEEFLKNQFPNMEQRKKIAKTLDLTQQHIQIWFQNRRAKKRRKKKRHSEEEKMRKDPEPPPFWPSNLPFSSNLGDILMKSTEKKKPGDSSVEKEAPDSSETNGRDSPSLQASESSPTLQQESQLPQRDYTPPPILPPTSPLPLNNKQSNESDANNSTSTRPSQLPCSADESATLNSPSVAPMPGNVQLQLKTPPPYVAISTCHSATSSFSGSTMSHPETSQVVLTPPNDPTLHNYPPLPPPDSLLVESFSGPGNYSHSLGPLCDPSAQGGAPRRLIPPPPPYSFGSSLVSSSVLLSSHLQYTPDHHSTVAHTSIFTPSNPLTFVSSPHLSAPHPKSLSQQQASEAPPGPSSLSPTTLSPITSSDCSPSPITQDVALPAPSTLPSERDFPTLSATPTTEALSQGLSSPIHATDPVALTDLQDDWEAFSHALCPVVQTGQEMWSVPPLLQPAYPLTSKSGSSKATSCGGLPSSHLYPGVYGMGYFPPFSSDPVTAVASYAAITSISNGAN